MLDGQYKLEVKEDKLENCSLGIIEKVTESTS